MSKKFYCRFEITVINLSFSWASLLSLSLTHTCTERGLGFAVSVIKSRFHRLCSVTQQRPMWRVAAPPLWIKGASVIVAPVRQPGGGATGMKSTASPFLFFFLLIQLKGKERFVWQGRHRRVGVIIVRFERLFWHLSCRHFLKTYICTLLKCLLI